MTKISIMRNYDTLLVKGEHIGPNHITLIVSIGVLPIILAPIATTTKLPICGFSVHNLYTILHVLGFYIQLQS